MAVGGAVGLEPWTLLIVLLEGLLLLETVFSFSYPGVLTGLLSLGPVATPCARMPTAAVGPGTGADFWPASCCCCRPVDNGATEWPRRPVIALEVAAPTAVCFWLVACCLELLAWLLLLSWCRACCSAAAAGVAAAAGCCERPLSNLLPCAEWDALTFTLKANSPINTRAMLLVILMMASCYLYCDGCHSQQGKNNRCL